MPRSLALLIVVAIGAAGCGGSSQRPEPVKEAPGGEVVRAWSDALRHGDVDAATARFGVPAVVANGTPEVRLTTRAQVRAFNSSLSCGSRVTAIVAHHGVLIASFTLTDRPGGNCGNGVGHAARVAFLIRGHRIVRWLRLDTTGEPPGELI